MNIRLPNSVLYPSPSKGLPKIRHRIGNVYFVDDGEGPVYCVLAQVGSSLVTPISLENFANRWSIPVVVKDTQKISQEEFVKMCGNDDKKFTYAGRLESVLKITPGIRTPDILLDRIFGEEK